MLDLVFRNGQAPSLNSDNLNAMVTAINRNELKAVDLQEQVLKINNSEVIANPDKKPRYSLRTVSIGDKVYLVDGNSGTTMYNLLGTQTGEVITAFYPEENTKQIVLMAIYNRHYQGAATIDLENKTIQATAASVEKEIYDKYVGQLWDDNHSVGNSFTYNVIADNWYEFYWDGYDGFGTETLKVDESGKLLVNSSFYALEVAVFSLEKTSVITADTGIEKTEAEYLVIEQAGEEETDAIYFITDKNYIVRNKIRYANIEHKAENTIITDEYSASKSYIAGDYLIFNNTLYKVKIACSGVTPPNTTYYEAVTVVSEVTQLKTSLNEKAQGRSVTLNNHSSKTIKFKNYNTCAFITAGNNFYVYNYGYLFAIKSESNINVTLASDYVTITVDNTTNTNYYLGIVVMNDVEYIIS